MLRATVPLRAASNSTSAATSWTVDACPRTECALCDISATVSLPWVATFYEREGFMVVNTEPASSGDPNAAIVWRRLELRD